MENDAEYQRWKIARTMRCGATATAKFKRLSARNSTVSVTKPSLTSASLSRQAASARPSPQRDQHASNHCHAATMSLAAPPARNRQRKISVGPKSSVATVPGAAVVPPATESCLMPIPAIGMAALSRHSVRPKFIMSFSDTLPLPMTATPKQSSRIGFWKSGSMRFELSTLVVTIILLNLRLFSGTCPVEWIFLPARVASGEWWRVVTHPFVHVSWYHLLLDASAFILYQGLAKTNGHLRIGYLLAGGPEACSFRCGRATAPNGRTSGPPASRMG
jgi:hypothetical protein